MADHGTADATRVPPEDDARAEAASDLRGAAGWLVLGIAVLVASLRMDRLEQQNINPYTVPGLLPGLLGIVMILLGAMLAVRGARVAAAAPVRAERAFVTRTALVIGLCLVFGVGLVGHGLPFWLASALFVAVAIVTLQAPQRAALGKRLGWRDAAFAIAVGLGAGAAITLVFQQLFLVRLP